MVVYKKSDIMFYITAYTLLILVVILVAFPIINIIARSFSSSEAVIQGKVFLFPVRFDTFGYQTVFKDSRIWLGYGNSVIYVVFGTLINLVFTICAAYPLSRHDFSKRNIILKIFIFTMLFSGGLIPTFFIVKNMGIYNTRFALWLPNAIAIYNVIVARTFFAHSVPREMLESAKMDGCSDLRYLVQILLPLSGAIIAVEALWYAVGHWNSYFPALIYIKREALFPLQIILRNILLQNQIAGVGNLGDVENMVRQQSLEQLIKYCVIVVSTLPVMALYPFVQKYFVKGVMIGSVKG